MKLKTTTIEGKTYAEVQDGKPVFVHDDGKDVPFDAPAAVSKISALNGEAKGHREAKEAAEAKLRAFDGITDAAAALKALETVKNLDDKKLVDAGEVEKVKAEAIRSVEEKYKPTVEENAKLKKDLAGERIGNAFANSKFISEKVAVPADIIQARFGERFKIEDGKIVAYDAAGNKVFSREKHGEPAGFDEALETLVSQYPYKEHILKGTGASGSGAKAGSGSSGADKTITRAEFNKLGPQDQMTKVTKDGFKVVD